MSLFQDQLRNKQLQRNACKRQYGWKLLLIMPSEMCQSIYLQHKLSGEVYTFLWVAHNSPQRHNRSTATLQIYKHYLWWNTYNNLAMPRPFPSLFISPCSPCFTQLQLALITCLLGHTCAHSPFLSPRETENLNAAACAPPVCVIWAM